MSKVYIEGMKMPKDCTGCALRAYDDETGIFYCSAMAHLKNIKSDSVDKYYETETKHPNCPLREGK